MAQDGLARAIRPVHAPFDGDVVFALATGRRPLGDAADYDVARLGALAADCLARAIARAVYEATPWPGADVRCWTQG
jgi:L-aminopeptidase/D-esterase-like protein